MTSTQRRAQSRTTFREVRSRGPLRAATAMFGPALVAAVAYIDPGNFATNFAAGARHGYQLVWVIVMANAMAMLIQYLSAKAGLATGLSLPRLCRGRLSRRVNIVLWLQAEVVAMATDLAEFAGAALGLRLLFGMPLLPAGLVTGVISLGVLGLQRRGYRHFEVAIAALLGLVAAGVFYLLAAGHVRYGQVAMGLLPQLGGTDAISLTVGIIGATVMPHVVYLHSALYENRIHAADDAERQSLLRYNKWDCITGLGLAGLVNLAMLCVGASLLRTSAGGGDLTTVHAALGRLVGGGAALSFAVALLASGVSSSSVGTYSGQVVAAGFVNLKVPLFARRLATMAPALITLAFVGDTSAVLVWSQVVLSFGIPFALIPLLILTRDRALMGQLANRRVTNATMSITSGVIIALNIALLATAAF
ncbi:MAG TPA: Nramp family divalent metal transporter [Trebonia sp.]